jgi:hypothetical protein
MDDTVEVQKTVDILKGEDNPDTIEVDVMKSDPLFVQTEYGQTENLGNYESARASVGLTVPSYKEEFEEVYKFVRNWTRRRVNEETKKIRNDGGVSNE